ncbi:endonuclease III [Candidatus Roizmanbacteria bacterium CG_4_10_14_0_8_um_filter_33_9]|uniref:Endonuclease III n=1 Tax=Candidatus Roizmanbacteria bacterium CG_4_10_14_0_8_um_filter_33_9 TaxID=1974826 RepID=A0A2M7QKD8_9BACT|nr:MAG: endonuclease III [Candidatus Roizmanbacteria bacterium CG_4_10_14_0_8_um_filter_33_9]
MKKNKKHEKFIDTVWKYYVKNKRDLPWRKTTDPYQIFVSEVMLQQTQVSRVLIKYPFFINQFPTFKQLAQASITEVLKTWQGMGYNRRALYLKKAASIIINQYNGIVPDDPVILDTLPGVGEATACSIVAFAYNKPTVFIETNIRRVFIYHFFEDRKLFTLRGIDGKVDDREILSLVEQTLDHDNPREWYWAFMDYGSYLGKTGENPNKKSKHYTIQTQFEGSDRQIRGKILKLLLEHRRTEQEMIEELKVKKKRVKSILDSLEKEGFTLKKNDIYCLVN